MQVSFGSFIPTRVMLLQRDASMPKDVSGTEAANDILALLCADLRNDEDSPSAPSVERHRELFLGSVPSYVYPVQVYNKESTPDQNVTTLVVEDEKNPAMTTKYILTGGDTRYVYDMGSLLRRRSEPWRYGRSEPFEEGEAGQLKAKATMERQKSLRAMVEEHAFPKTLVVSATELDPDGKTKGSKYMVQDIKFVENPNPGLDFTA